MVTWRVLGPKMATAISVNGRVISGTPGGVYDLPDGDSEIHGANGFVKVCLSGPTSARPTTSQAANSNYFAAAGRQFFDTSLSKLIVFDGSTWRDPSTGASV